MPHQMDQTPPPDSPVSTSDAPDVGQGSDELPGLAEAMIPAPLAPPRLMTPTANCPAPSTKPPAAMASPTSAIPRSVRRPPLRLCLPIGFPPCPRRLPL